MSDTENADDLLSVLAGMESALADIGAEEPPPATVVDVTESRSVAIVGEPSVEVEPSPEPVLREDPFQPEATTYPDDPPPLQGVPRAQGTTAEVLASIAWGAQ